MIRYPILDVCARIEGHELQHKILRENCRDFDDWQGLLTQSELEGMTPLLKKHLEESASIYPASVRRSLHVLAKHHQHQANVRSTVLLEILNIFQREHLTPVLIKGAALAHTIYPDSALRPMRDMDILLSKNEVDGAQELLRNVGFAQSKSPIPADHYHLPSLLKTVADVTVCIELHRGLYPQCPPYYPKLEFNRLLATARKFEIADTQVLTLDNEETLNYLYQHAFRSPLTYESYKLINAADIISFTERYYKILDWARIERDFPFLYRALPLMHHISPWDFSKIPIGFVSLKNRNKKLSTAPYAGWPHKRLKELKASGKTRSEILFNTFWPPSWWVQVYYGANSRIKKLWCLLTRHPRNILWWVKLYSSLKK